MYSNLPVTATETAPLPQVGDIVSAFLPVYYNKGVPGPTPRLALVLGLEVDPVSNSLEGLWLTRLSERTDKVRSWDFYLEDRDVTDPQGQNFKQDYVIRTPRIDLLPASGAFMDDFTVLGRVKSYFWDMFEGALHAGQRSSWAENNYGPREKLPHTVVKTSLGSRDVFSQFDYQTMIGAVQMPPLDSDRELSRPNSRREAEFNGALTQKDKQDRDLRRMIHAAFTRAQRLGQPWDQEQAAARALAYWHGGQNAPECRPTGMQ